jgi:putative (di)nucleoside polyphosphate hydrolase|tara:strand:- start:4775 stop:5320 length:546 start_codon:yes stop_codon:yes gene_type:complete
MFNRFLVENIIVIDQDGFRPNVGIIISDDMGRLLWAKRIGQEAWQFPQGGIDAEEPLETALYRELFEEVGLEAQDVDILACTQQWLRYRLPQSMQRKNSNPYFVGQKQKWFLLKLLSNENKISLDQTSQPEFDRWAWVNYWYPINQIVEFKRNVYRQVLKEFSPLQCNLEKMVKSYPRRIK